MKPVREILGRIWSIFRRNGIADDLLIIQHLAAILIGPHSTSADLETLSTSKLGFAARNEIESLLIDATLAAGGKANLFDQYILFSLPNILAGGRYPTPRHLVACMHRLAAAKPDHSVADLACGSGGFLVRTGNDPTTFSQRRVGVEISSDWARLASANAVLHGFDAQIVVGNALLACSPAGELGDERYDRILMNPPFGELMDPLLVQSLAGKKVGVRSDVVLISLALDRLTKSGRAAVLVPQRVLFGKGTESTIRQRLVEEFQLEAVVELPRDALQPYSSVQTHILLARSQAPGSVNPTWFFRVEEDGYPSGRARDLTEPPNGSSDLPFMEAVIHEAAQTPANPSTLYAVPVLDGKGVRLGLVVRTSAPATLVSVLELQEKRGHWLIVTVESANDNSVRGSTHRVSISNGQVSILENPEIALRNSSTETLLQEGKGVVAVAISEDVRLLGVAVAHEALREPYDLRPDHYLMRPVQKVVDASPAEVLARIRSNQQLLSKQLDNLLGQLELNPAVEQRIPPRLAQAGLTPFGALSEAQLRVWEKILKKTEQWKENDSEYQVAVHFTANEVEPEDVEATPSTRATLDIFERMGLIVTVTIQPPPRREPAVVYRRTTERDLWESK